MSFLAANPHPLPASNARVWLSRETTGNRVCLGDEIGEVVLALQRGRTYARTGNTTTDCLGDRLHGRANFRPRSSGTAVLAHRLAAQCPQRNRAMHLRVVLGAQLDEPGEDKR